MEGTSDDNETKLLRFMDITAGKYSVDQARSMLESSDYNLDQAVQLFFNDNDNDEVQGNVEDEDNVRPAYNIRETRILVEDDVKNRHLQNVKKRVVDNFRDYRTETEIQECLANGVPVPKKTRMEDIYRPPIDITFHADFQSAKRLATNEGKWIAILINDENFPSLALNRDIFNHTYYSFKIKNTMRNNFVFLRKRFDDTDGAQIMQSYQLSVETLPVLMIIDPTTGELRHHFRNTSQLTAKQFYRTILKYKSERKQLKFVEESDIDDSEDDDHLPFDNNYNGNSSRNFIKPSTETVPESTSTAKPQKSSVLLNADSDDDFESPESSDNDDDSDQGAIKIKNESPKIDVAVESDSGSEKEVKTDGTQTNIMLRLEDGTSNNFRYRSTKTVGSLISHIYNKYLIKTGIYDDKKKRMVLFSKIHNKCLTSLDSSQTLIDIKLHPSGVIYHNSD